MKTNKAHLVIEEDDFDPIVWQKAQLKNNSGYLDD